MHIRLAKLLLVIMTLTGVFMPIHSFGHELADSAMHHQIDTDNHHNDKCTSQSCDHCCHYSAHSLGMIRMAGFLVPPHANRCPATPVSQYASLNHAPPYHPPIA